MEQPDSSRFPKMGRMDDMFYTSVEVPIESFPRIKFFQSKLDDIFRRLQKVYEPIPECLKPPTINFGYIHDAVCQLKISEPCLFLFGSRHSRIPNVDLVVKEHGPRKVETHELEEIPSFNDREKKSKLFVAVCTIRMIETQKGRETLLQLQNCIGVENMLFFIDTNFDLNKDMVDNNLKRLRDFLKQKTNIVFQSKTDLSTAISNHMEQKFISAFHLLHQYLIEATRKTKHSCGCIFGHEDANRQLAIAIMEFFKTPLTILDLLHSTEPASAENVIDITKTIAVAIVRFTKTVLIREILSTYQLKGFSVADYLEKQNYDETCMLLLEKSNVVDNALLKSQLITQLQKIAENHKKCNSVVQLLSTQNPVARLYDYQTRKVRAAKNRLQEQFEVFSTTVAKEASDVLMTYFLDMCSNIKAIRSHLDKIAPLKTELQRIMEQTIAEEKYAEVTPDIRKWRGLLASIKEVKAVGHIFEKLYVFVEKPDSDERENEVRWKIRKYLVDYPGEFCIGDYSYNLYAGVDGIESVTKITMGDGFISEDGRRGTIGLFMNEKGNESCDLYFLTSSHVLLGSKDVTTNDPKPVPLGRCAHSLTLENKLLAICAIQVYPHMRDRCNPLFHDHEYRKCHILNMDSFNNLIAVGQRVYKRGSSSRLTRGCILSTDFALLGLQKDIAVIGAEIGCEEPFALPGDSGSVVYCETADGEIQYISILLGEFASEGRFDVLEETGGPFFLTICLCEELNQLEIICNCKLTLPELPAKQ